MQKEEKTKTRKTNSQRQTPTEENMTDTKYNEFKEVIEKTVHYALYLLSQNQLKNHVQEKKEI